MFWLYRNIKLFFFGMHCPECDVKPLHAHESDCSIGDWDGGTWA